MTKKRLTQKQYRDEIVRRQIHISRYATGQVNYVHLLIAELNEGIAKFLIRKSFIETKSQYAECKKFIKNRTMIYREKLYKYLQKELKDFIIEQSKWVYTNSPIQLEKVSVDRIVRDVFFTAFSDTDNIKNYVTRIFNQIFQIWNAQLTIAYRIRQSMKDMVNLILDKEFK